MTVYIELASPGDSVWSCQSFSACPATPTPRFARQWIVVHRCLTI